MNLFRLDNDPYKAAQYLCNKHIVKMPTESANMLLIPFRDLGIDLPLTKSGRPIRLSHENHPASVWIRKSRNNYLWALENLYSMCSIYKSRYKASHFASNYQSFCLYNYYKLNFEEKEQTPPPRCFSSYANQITEPDPVKAYRQFYILDKPFARWPSTESIPDWWPERSEKFVDKTFVNGNYIKR